MMVRDCGEAMLNQFLIMKGLKLSRVLNSLNCSNRYAHALPRNQNRITFHLRCFDFSFRNGRNHFSFTLMLESDERGRSTCSAKCVG